MVSVRQILKSVFDKLSQSTSFVNSQYHKGKTEVTCPEIKPLKDCKHNFISN